MSEGSGGGEMALLQKLKEKTVFAALGLVLLFLLGFGIESTRSMPDNARVFIDTERDTYLAPPCVRVTPEQEQLIESRLTGAHTFQDSLGIFVETTSLLPAVRFELRELDVRPDPDCRDSGAFFQEGRSLSGLLLQRVGLLEPVESRWRDDGSWKW